MASQLLDVQVHSPCPLEKKAVFSQVLTEGWHCGQLTIRRTLFPFLGMNVLLDTWVFLDRASYWTVLGRILITRAFLNFS